ncbi:DUF1071 domain-containing protein [Treponema sp.]|uniref:Sak single strand annealing protein n=1 Tax=Treponema sp. TaxID=166 RepID=UPI00388CF192
MDNYFAMLNAINVSGKTEKKNGLTYLSWAWAWGEVKKLFPDATYTIYENSDGWNYHTDGRTCWVKTGVTVNGIEHIEMLPVMDFRNNSIPLDKVTSFDVNKAIQRSLTKAVARHGLGLYIYAGEDLPEEEGEAVQEDTKKAAKKPETKKAAKQDPKKEEVFCEECDQAIIPIKSKDGRTLDVNALVQLSQRKYGRKLCAECMKKLENEQKGKGKNA